MEWCPICGNRDLVSVEWVEASLFTDDSVHHLAVLCPGCGWIDHRTTNAVPV